MPAEANGQIKPFYFRMGSEDIVGIMKTNIIKSRPAPDQLQGFKHRDSLRDLRPNDVVEEFIIDPEVEWEIKAEDEHSPARFSYYQGLKVKGKPVMSLLRGEILMENGQLRQSPGIGRFVMAQGVLLA